jgi:uncharacterized sporulation protein YeaH/YhbH (DUF444 family)
MADETQGQSGAADQNQQGVAGQQDTQGDATSNDNGSASQGDQGQQNQGDTDKYRKAFEDQQRRAEKAEARVKELEANGNRPAQTNNGQDLSVLEQRTTRAELAAYGVKTRAEQDFVISAAKRLGIDPAEALSDDIVAARLEKMREAQKTQEATPAPSRGGGSTKSSGKLPDFSKMTSTEFAEWERKNRK